MKVINGVNKANHQIIFMQEKLPNQDNLQSEKVNKPKKNIKKITFVDDLIKKLISVNFIIIYINELFIF